MSSSFECAWESVRPVPRVSIDFGDGHTLERTLHGNVVTYFCTPEGEVFDLVPGLVDPREYVRRLEQAVRLGRALNEQVATNAIQRGFPAGVVLDLENYHPATPQ